MSKTAPVLLSIDNNKVQESQIPYETGVSLSSESNLQAGQAIRTDGKKQKIKKKVHEMIMEIELLLNLSEHELSQSEVYEFVKKFNGVMSKKLV